MMAQKEVLSRRHVAQALITISVIAFIFWCMGLSAHAAGESWNGTGEKDKPYEITSAEQLKELADNVNAGNSYEGKYFILTTNLDLSSYASWTPIGTREHPFSGIFLGGGHEIYLVTVNSQGSMAGLFGYQNGTIKNLSVSGDVKGSNYVGGIAGWNEGIIQNCEFYGAVYGNERVGGIVGLNASEVTNCVNYGSAESMNFYIGGVAGENKGTITLCTNKGEISVSKEKMYIGGIAGYSEGNLSDCLNDESGKIDGYDKAVCVGGIVGASKNSMVQNCTNKASISGMSFMGGIAGELLEDSSVFNCGNLGTIEGSLEKVGGIAGELKGNNTVSNCTNMGEIICHYYAAGGIVASFHEENRADATITNCVNAGRIDGKGIDSVGGIVGNYSGNISIETENITNCTNLGEVIGSMGVGGIAGHFKGYALKGCVNLGKIQNQESVSDAVTGGIAGRQVNGRILECTNYGEISGDANYLGGIVGKSQAATIKDSINYGKVTSSAHSAGGIVGGALEVNGTIENCKNMAEIKGVQAVGGIAGNVNEKDITRCYNAGKVSASGDDTQQVGGIAGYVNSSVIQLCINKASITGNLQVGGIVGFGENKRSHENKIYQCHNDGAIYDNGADAGGIVGKYTSGTIVQCGNGGSVTSMGTKVGGVVGYATSIDVKDCYNRGAVYGKAEVGGIVGFGHETIRIMNSYCKAPSEGLVKGRCGVECEDGGSKDLHLTSVGGIIGQRTTAANLTLSHTYWWSKCSYRAIGWIDESFGCHDGDDYGFYSIQSRFKNPSNFKEWNFTTIWMIDTNAEVPVLQYESSLNKIISPAGGTGGTGGTGGNGGTGNSVVENVYVYTLDDLKTFRDSVNGGQDYKGEVVYLCADLDLGNQNWTSIGTNDHPFCGTFKGQCHTIKGFRTTENGLFGYIKNARIEKLAVYGSVDSSEYCVGGIVGKSDGVIDSCFFYGDVKCSQDEGNVGGIVGYMGTVKDDHGIYNCGHVGNVALTSSFGYAGGVVGCTLYANQNVVNCFHYGGKVTSGKEECAGGVAGKASQGGFVKYCVAWKDSAQKAVGTYVNSPTGCYMLTEEEFRTLRSDKYANWDMGTEEGHVWAMGVQYPLLQCFSDYYILSPNGGDDEPKIMWFPKDNLVLPDISFTRQGYNFNGWNSKPDGSGDVYYANSKVAARMTLYAQWVKGTPYQGYIPFEPENYKGVKDDQNYAKLLDGNANTKWCVAYLNGNEELTIEFATKDYVKPCGYGFVTGEDAEKYKGRNPVSWTLYGKANEDGIWTVIADVADDTSLPDRNSTLVYKDMDNNKEYCYYKLVFHWRGGKVFQMSEFFLMVDDPDTDVRKPRITFDANGADADNFSTKEGQNLSDVYLIENPYERDGYKFKGWNTKAGGDGDFYLAGAIVKIKGDAELFAQWEAESYSITFYKTNELSGESFTLDYTIEDEIEMPTLTQDEYSFDGWMKLSGSKNNWEITENPIPGGTKITGKYGDVSMRPIWSKIPKYMVYWVNDDNSSLYSEELLEGSIPEYKGNPPKMPATDEFTFEFSDWDKTPEAIHDVTTYKATYIKNKRSYTITWKDDEGKIIDTTTVEYGTVPTHADATKKATDEKTYVFSGWTPNVTAVKGDAEYTAVFSDSTNSYEITWKDDEGKIIDTTTVEYGKVPTHADAVKEATAEFTYTFTGWDVTPVAVTGKATYQATFSKAKNSYEITWLTDEGKLIDVTTVEYGTVPTHADAVKKATEENTYTFTGWDKTPVAVTGKATYKATFGEAKNSYEITWLMDDGSLIDTTTVEYGTVPTHADALKADTADYTYTFIGWDVTPVAVTKDATYKAVFEETKKSAGVNPGGSTPGGSTTVVTNESGDYLDELRARLKYAIALGGEQSVYWDKGTSLPKDVLKTLEEHPGITLVFEYVYENEKYSVTMPGKIVKTVESVEWYGPVYLYCTYGKAEAEVATSEVSGIYVVKSGDTLSRIARKLHVKQKYLLDLNKIKNPDFIRAGQVLKY